MARLTEKAVQEKVDEIWRHTRTWGDLERAAGITDRIAWWGEKSEEQARSDIRLMLIEQVKAGDIR